MGARGYLDDGQFLFGECEAQTTQGEGYAHTLRHPIGAAVPILLVGIELWADLPRARAERSRAEDWPTSAMPYIMTDQEP